MSLDEAAAVHEQITRNFREVEWMPRFNQRHGMWIPVYFAIAIVMTFLCRKTILSVWKAYPKQSRIIAVGATILVLGGVGLEILSYWYLRDAKSSFLFILEVTLEEFFEMAGASIILYGTILCALQTPHDGPKA